MYGASQPSSKSSQISVTCLFISLVNVCLFVNKQDNETEAEQVSQVIESQSFAHTMFDPLRWGNNLFFFGSEIKK